MERLGPSKSRDQLTNAGMKLLISSKGGTRLLSSAENDMPAPENLYERLRRLAVEDPREAKVLFLETFEANSRELSELLTHIGKPNEGRLRQVVANAIRTHPEKARIITDLVSWRETETDEFTRRAIEGALVDVDPAGARPSTAPQRISAP